MAIVNQKTDIKSTVINGNVTNNYTSNCSTSITVQGPTIYRAGGAFSQKK